MKNFRNLEQVDQIVELLKWVTIVGYAICIAAIVLSYFN